MRRCCCSGALRFGPLLSESRASAPGRPAKSCRLTPPLSVQVVRQHLISYSYPPNAESIMPSSSTGNEGKSPAVKRSYVACDGCRSRKVRCVLGTEPPCEKCQREHRECVFQQVRKGSRARHREAPKWANGQPSIEHERTITTSQSNPTHHPPVQSTSPIDEASPGRRHTGISDPVVTTFLSKPSDALNVLFDAARPASSPRTSRVQISPSQPRGTESLAANGLRYSNANIVSTVNESGLISVTELSCPGEEILDLWDRFRFVRQGWFTAQEAVTYIDLVYKYLAPLSPVLTDSFHDYAHHHRLVVEEPLLCCTLIMIASRYFFLPGAGGISRSHAIHQRIWQYCELLLRRIMLGQEKMSTAKTRVLASIESFLLITDWHPRSLHLPPEHDGIDSELISPGYDRRNRTQIDSEAPLVRWREDVFEPAKRAERMSWMLLGAAVSLASELGMLSDGANSFKSEDPQEQARAQRLRRLLHIYVTRMSVNTGAPSPLPENLSCKVSAATPESSGASGEAMKKWELCMKLWEDLARLRRSASAIFFQSTTQTKQQLQSGNYSLLLQHLEPALHRWEEELEASLPNLPEGSTPLMAIEFGYLRTYTSALSIQAVVDRAVARNINNYGGMTNEGLQSCILPQDSELLALVRVESTKVLQLATNMAVNGQLRFAPHNTLLYITSSSVFLLKAIGIGARNVDIQESLEALDRCIHAMRSSPTDDMDFSIRYATLLERHVNRFRENLVIPNRQVKDTSRTSRSHLSRGHTNPPTDARATDFSLPGQSAPDTGNVTMQDFYSSQMTNDEWWACPFDPSIAPFGINGESLSLSLEPDTLDFLWNIGLPGN
ncbi:hypothetical protein CC79DRAFT_1184691 [Sarocladium strictum]